jgi:hypothetical protein
VNYKLAGSAASAAIMGGAVVFLAFIVGKESKTSALNLLIVILGLAIGWLFGILLSPYSESEGKKFTKYAKVFGVFASGYLVGKIDKVIEELLKPEFILDSVHGFRIISFLAALIIGLIFTFVFRRYG